MGLKTDVDLLQKIPFFSNLDTAHLQLLAFVAPTLSIEEGDLFVRKGDTKKIAYLLLSGRAYAFEKDDSSRKIATFESGAFIGEIAMLAKTPYTFSVRAQTPCVVREFSHDLLLRLCKEFPEAGQQLLTIVKNRLEGCLSSLYRVSYFSKPS